MEIIKECLATLVSYLCLRQALNRVDGVMYDKNAKKYFYHTDHLGSIKVVTDID